MPSDPLRSDIAPAKRLRLSAVFLSLVTVLSLANALTGWPAVAFAAVPFLVAYFVWEWHRLLINARVLILACAGLTVFVALQSDALSIFGIAASRMIYLPAFIAVLGLMRAAASASAVTASAGRHLIIQPPSRRYVALSLGSHFFSVLFNIGGLALLIDLTKKANTLEAAGGDPRIVHWRERRMTTAIQRGFASVAFWSPLGVAVNFLLTSIPGLTWIEIAPLGIASAAAFIGLGWIFDQLQRPPGLRPRLPQREPHGTRAVAAVLGHVVLVSGLAGVSEYLLGLSFQIVLLIVVPTYAFFWAAGSHLANKAVAPLRAALTVLLENGVKDFPTYANEIVVFSTSSFLGVCLIALVPLELLQAFFCSLSLPPGILAGLLTFTVAALALVGINPLISAAIIAGALSSVDIPGLSNIVIALALAAGWATCAVAAPYVSTVVLVSSLIGRKGRQVGLAWNGAFAVTAVAIAMILLAIFVRA